MPELKKCIEAIAEIVLHPYILLSAAFIILCVDRFFLGKQHLSCIGILEQHIGKIKSEKHGRFSLFVYFIVPLIISIALGVTRIIDNDVINTLTVIVSILTAMFFTLLTLVIDIRTKAKDDKSYNASDAKVMKKVLKETYYSLMFEIAISMFLLIACFINLFAKSFGIFMSVLIYYMTLVLIFNLFTILRRVFKVIEQSMK